jgi:tetratricopeptide (TPR) repeat protein
MPPRQESPQMYSDVGDAYSQERDFIRAIRAYKRALELSPEPDLAMLICWNFALAIWFRAKFVNREDTNTTDDEWQEILAARASIDVCCRPMRQTSKAWRNRADFQSESSISTQTTTLLTLEVQRFALAGRNIISPRRTRVVQPR